MEWILCCLPYHILKIYNFIERFNMQALPLLLGNKVLIKVIEKKFTKGGLVLPASVEKNSPKLAIKEAIVESVGPGILLNDGTFHPCTVKRGDKVYVNSGMIGELEIGDTMYGLINESSIIAYFPDVVPDKASE